jgi:type II secretory pathway component GspD/PulD (secretin)
MKLNEAAPARRVYCSAKILTAFALAVVLAAPAAFAQTPASDAKPADAKPADTRPDTGIDQTFFLTNMTQEHDLNDVQTDLRNLLAGRTRIYAIPSLNLISIHGSPEDIERARKLITELDRPRKIYRLTYTITETDNGTQTIALVATSGDKTTFKQGSKVPIATGSYDSDNSKANTQFQYLDVGLNIEFTVEGRGDGLSLNSKVAQSSLAEEKSGFGPQDPVLRQTVVEGTSALTLGKPLILGSLDIPGTTRKQEIAVVSELVK